METIRRMNRRRFAALFGSGAAGLVLARCGPEEVAGGCGAPGGGVRLRAATASEAAMRQRPFRAKVEFQHTRFYPDAPPVEPAEGGARTEEAAEAELLALLDLRYPADAGALDQARAYFRSEELRALIPAPDLRAAFLTNLGTLGEGVVRGIMTDSEYRSAIGRVEWADLGDPLGVARLLREQKDGREVFAVLIGQAYRAEPLEELGHVLLHEFLIHIDEVEGHTNGRYEELCAALFQYTVLAQNRLLVPEHGLSGSALTRGSNSRLTALVNSTEAGSPLVDIYAVDGKSIFPGGETRERFVDLTGGAEDPTQGNVRFAAALQAMAARVGRQAPADPDYSEATVQTINEYLKLGFFSAEEWCAIAESAGLILPTDTGIEEEPAGGC